MISRIIWVGLIKINIRVEDSVPNSHEARIVSNVLGMMEDVVCAVSSEWNQSENTPWEFISAVSIVSFENSNETPLDNGEEVKLWSENEHSNHGGVMVAESKLKWVSIFTCNADWMHELVVLFVD